MEVHQVKNVKSIVILEDERIQAIPLSLELKRNNYEVKEINYNGVKTIESVKHHQPDIVLLDINLRGQPIDGIDVGREINKFNKEIILIYISAYPTSENINRAFTSNPHAFIVKPYAYKTLNDEIENAIQKSVESRKVKEEEEEEKEKEDFTRKVLCFPDFILVDESYKGYTRVPLSDVLYLEANNVNTLIKRHDKSDVRVVLNLGSFYEAINYQNFLKIHRSFVVNLNSVSHFKLNENGGSVTLINDKKLRITKPYVESFKKRWNELFGNDM